MSPALPNILWLCTDQQRFDTLGALGNRFVSTPHLDALVRRGVAFTRAYCQSPICTPSRASFLTGAYPSAVHVNGNGNEYFPSSPPLVTRLLADAGYDCGLIGKLHLAGAAGRLEPRVDDGYRYWQYSHAPRDDWPAGHAYADWVRAKGGNLAELLKSPAAADPRGRRPARPPPRPRALRILRRARSSRRLQADPHEFDNLWDAPATQPIKLELLRRSFDASMLAMDRGPRRLGPY